MRKILLSALLLNTFVSVAQVTLTNSPYVENFDNIGNGLPQGFFVATGANETTPGANTTFNTALSPWLSTTNGGFYNCASATGLINLSNPNQQALSPNRAISVRQTSSFGNPGAAFIFKINNTVGKTSFGLNFKLQTLDSTKQGISAWRVDYGIGANPTNFTIAPVTPTTFSTGGKPGTAFYVFNRTMAANFGTGLDNVNDIVWIRVWAPISTSDPSYSTAYSLLGFNNTTPTMSGIDDWNLNWTSTPPTNVSNISKSLEQVKISGFIGNDIQVTFNKTYNYSTITRLIDMNGAVLWEKQYGRIQANQTEWVRPGQLPKGIYLLQIQNAEGNITKRIAN
jgi:hypothetical protein